MKHPNFSEPPSHLAFFHLLLLYRVMRYVNYDAHISDPLNLPMGFIILIVSLIFSFKYG